ncbi:MAG: MBL fold metallo-hydrolase [Candidatus Lokiarchaeota archaeon]|nr:MBL fold metallo-hydrolase [Candidatus Lokiarchaeota archaeon]
MACGYAGARYGRDSLTVLGSGGGRYMATTQRRSTGGFVLQLLDGRVQCHVDPGPSAARDLRDWKVDPKRTSYIFLTHEHNDHDCEVPTVVEAMQDDMGFSSKKGTLIAPARFFDTSRYYFRLLQRAVAIHEGDVVHLEPGLTATATPAWHSDVVPSMGFVLEIGSPGSSLHYKLAVTSDTGPFEGYAQAYKGVDVLVANLLRPDGITCRGHMCTDQFIPLLREIRPAICILVHFGRRMDNEIDGNQVPAQVRKIEAAIGGGTRVIGSEDGQRVEFARAATR